jgi:hypothetical protein
MPARRDIEPAEILALLPYTSIFHEVNGQFRYRLAGTAVVQQIGRDPTGDILGAHVRNPRQTVAAVQTIGRRVFTTAKPVFSAGQCENVLGCLYNVSALILPLSDNGAIVDMALFTRSSWLYSRRSSVDFCLPNRQVRSFCLNYRLAHSKYIHLFITMLQERRSQ